LVENNTKDLIKDYYKIDFAKLARMVFNDLQITKSTNVLFNNFPKEKVIEALQNPQKNEKTLRNLSVFLYILSPHYKRLCQYYAQMLKYDYYIEPYRLNYEKLDREEFKRDYYKTLYRLDNMNIKHEFQKIAEIAFKEGIFYGYIYETNDSFFLQKIDPDFCQITSVEDGTYNFSFNFTYFDRDPSLLNNYASEFKEKYQEYKDAKADKSIKRKDLNNYIWRELDGENSICIKPDETVPFPFAPFCGVMSDLYDIQDYKSLKKASSEMDNYAIIVGNLPYNDKSDLANDFKLNLDDAIRFGNQISQQLPEQVGFLLSPYKDMTLFKLSDDKVGNNVVEEAVNSFWTSSGTTKQLFNEAGSTDASMKASIATDSQIMFNFLRQLERWLNRRLKYKELKYKFKANFLNTTYLNEKEVVERELKSAQFGVPNKIRLCTALGMSQSSVDSMAFLENEILGLHDKFIPLQSSHTSNNTNSPTNGNPGKPNDEQQNLKGS